MHLTQFRDELVRRSQNRSGGGRPWFSLRRPVAELASKFLEPKLLSPDIAKRHRFSLDVSGIFPGNTVYGIPLADRYLLGIINSTAAEEIYVGISSQVRGGYVRFFRQYVERIPVPLAKATERQAIEALVQKCLDAKGQGPQVPEWEAEIDERVAWLYGLKTPPGRPESGDDA